MGRTLTGRFVGSSTALGLEQAAATLQAAARTPAFQAELSAQALTPLAALWAPEVRTELWSQGDTVVASPADGGTGVTATVNSDGGFSLTLKLNVTYSLQLVRDGSFIAYLSNPDGTPINIMITAAGAEIDLGSIRIADGRFVAGIEAGTYPGVDHKGLPADYEDVLDSFESVSATLSPTGVPASELYTGALFLAVDESDLMVGMGTAPNGALTVSVPAGLASAVTNFVTIDEHFLSDIVDLPANTPTYPIQVPYFEVGQDFGSSFPETIDDGVWGMFEAIVVDEAGTPIEDALVAAVSVAVGGGDATPKVMVLNIGRSDEQGQVRFYLLRSLASDGDPGDTYVYSLTAASTLDGQLQPLYDEFDGSPALFTPVAGSSEENRFQITLGDFHQFQGDWEMVANNTGPLGTLSLDIDGTYRWDGDTGTWSMYDGAVYLNDGWGDNWRLEYGVDSEGEFLEVYTLIGSTWDHWGYAFR